jgi:hypothetical protein
MPKADIIYDHYKDTCGLSREKIGERNRFFVSVWVVILILWLLTVSPDTFMSALMQWAKDTSGIDLIIGVHLLQTFAWLILLYFFIRYVQATVYVERQYPYIKRTEEKLSATLKEPEFITREGKSYLGFYPTVNDFIHFLYTKAFPAVAVIAVFGKIIVEWWQSGGVSAFLVLDSILALCTLTLVIIYCCFVYEVANMYETKSKTH